jgi:hypothetical protein
MAELVMLRGSAALRERLVRVGCGGALPWRVALK